MAAHPKCAAKTAAGKQCQMPPSASGYCFAHDPGRGGQRAKARRAGGKARHVPHSAAATPAAQLDSLADARAILAYALAETLVMDNSILRTRALVAIAQAGIEAWKIGELEQRLAAIEAAMAQKVTS